MNDDEIKILRFRMGEWKTLKPLEEQISRSTLYKLAKSLCGRNLLVHRKGKGYMTTKRALRELDEYQVQQVQTESLQEVPSEAKPAVPKKAPVDLPAIQDLLKLSDRQVNMLQSLYPPLKKVPTVTHEAIIELLWAEVCDRQWPEKEDHHLNFLTFGDTFTWKTSCAQFCAYMISGEEITAYLIEPSTESGGSLLVRKKATGEIASERGVLQKPYLCLEDYHQAKSDRKAAAVHLLKGRTRVPMENGTLDIRCVTMVNLNPDPTKPDNLFDRTGFDAPQIRRFVPCNLDAIKLPNLRRIGQEALDAARQTGALELKEPVASCRPDREEMIEWAETLFTQEGQPHIDIEGLLNIARGMTGYGLSPSKAIRWVLYKVSLPYHTVGWLRPKWVEGADKMSAATGRKEVLISKVEPDKAIQTTQGQRLQLGVQKREQLQRVEETIKTLIRFGSPMCTRLREDFAELKAAIESADPSEALDDLTEHEMRALQPRLQEAIEEGKQWERQRFLQANAKEIASLLCCALLLDLGAQPGPDLEKSLERLGCIERVPDDFLEWAWKGVDGGRYHIGLVSWPRAKQLLWVRLQHTRQLLESVLADLSEEEADLVKRVLDPVRIVAYTSRYSTSTSIDMVITLLNSVGCSFEVGIALIFEDKGGMLLRRGKSCPFVVHQGRQEVCIEVARPGYGGGRLDSVPAGTCACSAKITSLRPAVS